MNRAQYTYRSAFLISAPAGDTEAAIVNVVCVFRRLSSSDCSFASGCKTLFLFITTPRLCRVNVWHMLIQGYKYICLLPCLHFLSHHCTCYSKWRGTSRVTCVKPLKRVKVKYCWWEKLEEYKCDIFCFVCFFHDDVYCVDNLIKYWVEIWCVSLFSYICEARPLNSSCLCSPHEQLSACNPANWRPAVNSRGT